MPDDDSITALMREAARHQEQLRNNPQARELASELDRVLKHPKAQAFAQEMREWEQSMQRFLRQRRDDSEPLKKKRGRPRREIKHLDEAIDQILWRHQKRTFQKDDVRTVMDILKTRGVITTKSDEKTIGRRIDDRRAGKGQKP
jgi:hypothetical protein